MIWYLVSCSEVATNKAVPHSPPLRSRLHKQGQTKPAIVTCLLHETRGSSADRVHELMLHKEVLQVSLRIHHTVLGVAEATRLA